MLKKLIIDSVKDHLKYTFTPGQEKCLLSLIDFIDAKDSTDVFILKGYAGTGKTSLISAFIKSLWSLKLKSVLLAPTGRAAKVLSNYSGKPAYTIHKKIYRQKKNNDGIGEFSLDRNLHRDTLFIVDEASMISNSSFEANIFGSGNLLNDLLEYVYSGANCKLILIGDTAQLPPVGFSLSPALDPLVIKEENFGVTEVFLTEIVRQEMQSGILYNATFIRKLIESKGKNWPQIQTNNFLDIISITGDRLIEEINNCYDKYGIENTIVITRSNKRANLFNKGIREQILFREETLSRGDLLMVVKNNYFWCSELENIDFIANGDIVELVKIRNYEERYGFRFADAIVKLPDYNDTEIEVKLLIDTLFTESPSLSSEENKKFFFEVAQDYNEEKSKKKRYEKIKSDPFFNALQIKYAYGITCHKAQGGQWNAVFLDQGYLTDEMLGIDYYRWLYTAFTRAVEKLFIVNFPKEMIEKNS